MNKDDFLREFNEILQCDQEHDLDTQLKDIEEWDSLSMMALIAYFDKQFGIALTFCTLKSTQTVNDIVALLPEGTE